MEQIKLTQTQTLSSAGSVARKSLDGPASAPTTIDEWVIVDEVLGVQRGHHKSVERIVKGKKKMPNTYYLTIAFG